MLILRNAKETRTEHYLVMKLYLHLVTDASLTEQRLQTGGLQHEKGRMLDSAILDSQTLLG